MSDQDRPQTRPAHKEAAVYGSPSFSQGLEADPSAQGDTGSVDQQQQQEEAPPPLTDTIRMGLDSMEQRRQQLHAMVKVDVTVDCMRWTGQRVCAARHSYTVCLPCMHHASTTSAQNCLQATLPMWAVLTSTPCWSSTWWGHCPAGCQASKLHNSHCLQAQGLELALHACKMPRLQPCLNQSRPYAYLEKLLPLCCAGLLFACRLMSWHKLGLPSWISSGSSS